MLKQTLLALMIGAASMTAQALTIERSTTISDDFGGYATIQSSGVVGEQSGLRVANAEFVNFHPRSEQSEVSGSVQREVLRDGELVSVSYDGSLQLSGQRDGQANELSIEFTDLRIERGEESADLSGTLSLNGNSIDAAEAPQAVRAVLLGLLRFFRA
ncbi:hypothetical protein [Pseudomarimonas arenosa]|uniref:Lipopolysaccharide export system protein LptA n=1 Tax=Pseudomarimonas arenosa TaxID=2774145 RepID=A0AAW3ZLX8_9GAMM|nr:hypothetical protein [Pseudomarimonas arenosa]MBD8526475.1 hypothetical protein [Pseudomarimonas arenosa]